MTPIDPIVEALVCRLDTALREAFEERAGIMQFEAGKSRELAESLALLDVIRTNPLAVSEVIAMRIAMGGDLLTVLTMDLQLARQHFQQVGALLLGTADLAKAVSQFGIAAALGPVDGPSRSR